MTEHRSPRGLTRRELLKSGVAAGASFVVGAGFLAHATEAWALETAALSPQAVATLIQMARDIYPHDRIADKFYAVAIKGHDAKAAANAAYKALLEDGIADLDARAARAGHGSYLGAGWEFERVAILREIEATPFFQALRGDLVVSLYNQKEVWPHFGYEGSSAEFGGYLERGFNDIAWL
ncbi:MAG: Twin-arginine translocation pathway signal [Thermohalobaculum sp.]|nr:Twin-arginine translocation pathway signal [Thermohalobaculum sp.]